MLCIATSDQDDRSRESLQSNLSGNRRSTGTIIDVAHTVKLADILQAMRHTMKAAYSLRDNIVRNTEQTRCSSCQQDILQIMLSREWRLRELEGRNSLRATNEATTTLQAGKPCLTWGLLTKTT